MLISICGIYTKNKNILTVTLFCILYLTIANVGICSAYFEIPEFNEFSEFKAKKDSRPSFYNEKALYIYNEVDHTTNNMSVENILQPFKKNRVYLDKIDITKTVRMTLKNGLINNKDPINSSYANLSVRNTMLELKAQAQRSNNNKVGMSQPPWNDNPMSDRTNYETQLLRSGVQNKDNNFKTKSIQNGNGILKSAGEYDLYSKLKNNTNSRKILNGKKKVIKDAGGSQNGSLEPGSDPNKKFQDNHLNKKQVNKKAKTPLFMLLMIQIPELIMANLRAIVIFLLIISLSLTLMRPKKDMD